ncbi:MAG: hypothetical protein J5842_04375, partial [Lachnospiraceae bacterium]|nr:hypothetical protein [Lachnospiraceae bacterium]
MNQVHKQTMFALSLMSITALAVVLVYMQMVNITNTAAGRLKTESADSLMDEVEGVLNDRMQEDINGICSAVYEDMVNEYGAEGNGQLGAVYKGEFYGRCANRLSLSYR